MKITHLIFDAANTLIYKPALWDAWTEVLKEFGHQVELSRLKHNHKLLSECIKFPDRTSKDFYKMFNSEVLLSLGIIPANKITDVLFSKCSYLPWQLYDDVHYLKQLKLPVSILSNFNNSLREKMKNLFPEKEFQHIIISEELECAKPENIFFQKAISIVKEKPENILYIGDSIKLDIIPGENAGMKTLLIDRDGTYLNLSNRINNLAQIEQHI